MLLRFGRKGRVAMVGMMGAAAAWQVNRRRKQPAPAPAPGPDPAQELRARLDESRAVPADQPPPSGPPAAEPVDPADRRASVHEEARARIDGLKSDADATEGS
jgi:hypothetical protein